MARMNATNMLYILSKAEQIEADIKAEAKRMASEKLAVLAEQVEQAKAARRIEIGALAERSGALQLEDETVAAVLLFAVEASASDAAASAKRNLSVLMSNYRKDIDVVLSKSGRRLAGRPSKSKASARAEDAETDAGEAEGADHDDEDAEASEDVEANDSATASAADPAASAYSSSSC